MLQGLGRGYAVASIHYRLSGEARFPAAVQDVKAAIRFLRAHAADYGLDAEFAALGTSGVMGPTSAPASPESRYLGQTVGTEAARLLVQAANPLTYLRPQAPSMLIQHGTGDRNVPITQSAILAARMAERLGADRVTFDRIEGAGHGGASFETPDNVQRVLDFLDRALQR